MRAGDLEKGLEKGGGSVGFVPSLTPTYAMQGERGYTKWGLQGDWVLSWIYKSREHFLSFSPIL